MVIAPLEQRDCKGQPPFAGVWGTSRSSELSPDPARKLPPPGPPLLDLLVQTFGMTHVYERIEGSLAGADIIKEGEGWVAREVVVAAGQGQGIGMTCDDRGRHLHPRIVVVAGSRQDGSGRSSSVVPERRRGPVKLDRIGTMDLVPEGQDRIPAGGSERLFDRTIAVGGRG